MPQIVRLKPSQIQFAEWLATPATERQPKTQIELAEQLGVVESTLCNWKRIPEVWDYRDSILRQTGKDLVPEALKKIKELLDSPNSKVALDAAKDILSRWSDPKRSAHIIATLKQLYQENDNPHNTDNANIIEGISKDVTIRGD